MFDVFNVIIHQYLFSPAIEKISQDIDNVDVLIADGKLMSKVLHHVQKVKWIYLIWAGKFVLIRFL